MTHEIEAEELSAYLDGELTPKKKAGVDRHLEACAECRDRLESLRKASARFRAEAARKAPESLREAVLGGAPKAEAAPSSPLGFALALAVLLLVLLGVGKLFKPQISQVFNQVMAMVSGAAQSVGSGN
ncbi:MAG: hypothetical protein A2X36_07210 [Elusimicrobia bacterium GWA2_69_24]|nr:MAG: hypothetical protein A2X36_07210 [Elusimicrobia bacterium GWA2_69_24]HBL15190.1 hypothetical protein [Elusimicrobiota bacterium]